MSRRLTRQRTDGDLGSSAVEFSLVVAAMAAMILAVVLGVGRVVGEMLFHGCHEISAQLDVGGSASHPSRPRPATTPRTARARRACRLDEPGRGPLPAGARDERPRQGSDDM